ncbi:hypothetical protein BDZ97DRAFT_973130 [Flammula alnicola]|nr:hypothetical protein BDZ97DRAFT_973130 [Flammula alnicola]
MDLDKSPDLLSPDHNRRDLSHSPISPQVDPNSTNVDMAAMVANGNVPNMPGPNKRYRPAPAKTFQCRGYGECRMVFSRSEHLARHIRKHTGERPFSCHCGKQFSRLDNLRQHAQTVHADKQDQNERMMRDLTSLHATMAAANKVGTTRGARRAPPVPALQLGANDGGSPDGSSLNLIKQEEMGSLPMHQRPGTSTGYEGDLMYSSSPSWHVQSNEMEQQQQRRPPGNHSFRDPGQSFLGPAAGPNSSTSSSSSAAAAAAAQSHSFRSYSGPLHHFIADSSRDVGRPGSSSSRPPTSSGLTDPQHPRSLPPLSAVVSASLPSPPQQLSSLPSHQQQSQQSQSLFPFPGSLAFRRPSTATRPGTAPASASFFSKSAYNGSSGMGSSNGRPELSLLHSGFGRSSSAFGNEHHQQFQLGAGYDAGEVPTSPSGHDSSPFYFQPPALDTASSGTSPSALNPRKRAFAGPDGPYDDAASHALRGGEPPGSSSGLGGGDASYEYGSESRPQSRRLSVMELCNDGDEQQLPSQQQQQRGDREQQYGSGAFLLSAAAAAAAGAGGGGNAAGYGYGHGGGHGSRPTTSSGLVSSASALHIFDRSNSPPPHYAAHVYARAPSSAAASAGAGAGASSAATAAAGGAGGAEQAEFRGGVYPASFRRVPSPGSGAAGAPAGSNAPSPHSPTPTPPPAASVLSSSSYRPAAAQQYQFAHSPTFSNASSAASYSPRSPLSDGSASPFSAYAQRPSPVQHDAAAAAAVSRARGDAGGQQQQQQHDGQVRTPLSPHAAASFGMRV